MLRLVYGQFDWADAKESRIALGGGFLPVRLSSPRRSATTTRRLPRSLAPLVEESLPGFLLRMAYRLGVSPGRIADLCGLSDSHGRLPYAYLRALPDELVRQLAHAARLTTEEAEALTLRRFAGAYPPLGRLRADTPRIGASASANWAVRASSRYCPECLRGDGGPVENAFGGPWRRPWHLPIVFACSRHHRLLEHECPECERPLNAAVSRRPGLIKNPRLVGLHPSQCRNRSPAEERHGSNPRSASIACGARLDENLGSAGRELPPGDLARLLSLQQRLIEHLVPTSPESDDASPMGSSFFPDLITTTHLIKLTWPLGEAYVPSTPLADLIDRQAARVAALVEARREGRADAKLIGTRTAPGDAAQCGALLLAADALLGDRDLASLRGRINPLTREAYRRSKGYASLIFRHGDISTTLSRATARRIYGLQTRRRLRLTAPGHRFRLEEVPAFVPRAWFDAHIAPLAARLPSRGQNTVRFLRRAASLGLAQLTSGAKWPECAVAMGLPEGCARYALHVLGRQLDEAHLWPAFEEAVEQIARDLDQQMNSVDYANRRQMMATWPLPVDDWLALSVDLPKLGRMRAKADPAIGSILVWSEVTQGEHLHSPDVAELREQGGNARMLARRAGEYYAATLRGSRLRLRQRLRLYANRLAAACDQHRVLRVPVNEIVGMEADTEAASGELG
ncbi:TniQ family protein [Streptomyces lunaelactis]|nr:TniQ family protein [Streptomyces lunaelactis]